MRHLRLELDGIVDRTLSIATAATFRHKVMRGQRVTMLELTDDQRARADETHARLMRWESALTAFLRRRGIGGKAEIERVVADLAPCVTFRWQDRDDVSERQWRTKLHRELLRVSADAKQHLAAWADDEERGIPQEPMPFTPFPLRIESLGPRRWRVCAGDLASESVRAPESFALGASAPDGVEHFGRSLFDLVFAGRVGEELQRARARGNLRIELDTRDAGTLHTVRWEQLHDGHQFLSLGTGVCLARSIAVTEPRRYEAPRPPLRLLATVSASPGEVLLGGRHELATLEAALAPLTMLGLVEIDTLSGSSFSGLRHRLRTAANAGRPYHVWHFIGHGEDDALVMTGDTGERRAVSGAELEGVFREHPSLTLVVLNSCNGVRFHDDGTTSGIAASLLRGGAPAVLAMQEEIDDAAAILLAEELYGALGDGTGLDTALTEMRRAIFFHPNEDWHIPVFLMAGG